MKMVLYASLMGVLLLPLRAEDWTTPDGKTYEDVQVLSYNAAYVTILDKDGGGRIALSSLPPDVQKRFGYDPAKAPAIVAATEAADQRDKQAVIAERDRMRIAEERQMDAISNGIATALFSPAPAGDSAAFAAAASVSPPTDEADADVQPIASEPPTEIDDGYYSPYNDGDYGYGYGYGYSGYGYGYGGYGHGGGTRFIHRGGSGTSSSGTHFGGGHFSGGRSSGAGIGGFTHR